MIKHLRSVVVFLILFSVCLTLIPSVEVRADSIELSYTAYVQTYGWQKQVSAGKTAGLPGQAKRIEAFRAKLITELPASSIQYVTYIHGRGWACLPSGLPQH